MPLPDIGLVIIVEKHIEEIPISLKRSHWIHKGVNLYHKEKMFRNHEFTNSFQSPRYSVKAHLADMGLPALPRDFASVSRSPLTPHDGHSPPNATSDQVTDVNEMAMDSTSLAGDPKIKIQDY